MMDNFGALSARILIVRLIQSNKSAKPISKLSIIHFQLFIIHLH